MFPQRFEKSARVLLILLGSLAIMGCSISWFQAFMLSYVNLQKWEDMINGPSQDIALDQGETAPTQVQPEPTNAVEAGKTPNATPATPSSLPSATSTSGQTCDASDAVSVEVVFEQDYSDYAGRHCSYKLYVINNSSQEVVLSVHVLMFKVTSDSAKGPEWIGHYVLSPGKKWEWHGAGNYTTLEGAYDTYSIVDRIAVTNKSCYAEGMPASGAEVEPYAWPIQYYCAP